MLSFIYILKIFCIVGTNLILVDEIKHWHFKVVVMDVTFLFVCVSVCVCLSGLLQKKLLAQISEVAAKKIRIALYVFFLISNFLDHDLFFRSFFMIKFHEFWSLLILPSNGYKMLY